jgi:tungstate transport system substrate-binding protein
MTAGSAIFSAVLLLAGCGQAPDSVDGGQATEPAPAPEHKSVILATTTSTQDSGLLDVLLPLFEEQTGYRVKTIAVGTGEALAMGKRGDVDVLLAHAPEKEKEIVAEGLAVNRRVVMRRTRRESMAEATAPRVSRRSPKPKRGSRAGATTPAPTSAR